MSTSPDIKLNIQPNINTNEENEQHLVEKFAENFTAYLFASDQAPRGFYAWLSFIVASSIVCGYYGVLFFWYDERNFRVIFPNGAYVGLSK